MGQKRTFRSTINVPFPPQQEIEETLLTHPKTACDVVSRRLPLKGPRLEAHRDAGSSRQ